MQVAVIGGTRGLGKWIANFLKKKGYKVIITGRNSIMGEAIASKIGVSYTSDNIKASSDSDVVILSLPIDLTPQTIKEIAPHIRKGFLLLDVTSVKELPAKVMYEHAPEGVEVLPTHPMFGPRVRSLDGQVVVLTPKNHGQWYQKVVDFLETEQARVLVTTPEDHDRMMSIVQGLTHFAYISVASAIERMKIDVKQSRNFASPIYSLMLDMIARIVAQNPYLCYSIQTQNRYIPEVHDAFMETFHDLKSMVDHKNQDGFVKAMSSAAKHLDDLEAALGRSDKAISALSVEVSNLKNSIGKEVGLRHMYSGKIHIGVLESLNPDFVTLRENNKKITLKLSNIEVLNSEEIIDWKKINFPLKSFDISVIFPDSSQPEIISHTINTLEDVVKVEIKDVYQGEQIPKGFKSLTFNYQVIYPSSRKKVEELLVGLGGKIR